MNLKPAMTVVLHATNHMLHAFRGGPQSMSGNPPSCTQSATNECGGEELWAFVPYDQLAKLAQRMVPQSRTNHTYVMAAPVRFADIFVPGAFSKAFAGGTASGSGVWRVMMIVGRGAGGKYLTGVDVTVPGPFTTSALTTRLPVVVWNRGNPDTNDGTPKSGANNYNNTSTDYNAYLKMGETWSVPAVGFTTAANNPTSPAKAPRSSRSTPRPETSSAQGRRPCIRSPRAHRRRRSRTPWSRTSPDSRPSRSRSTPRT
ncbi:MAG: hypothetical protein DMF82_10580 [Acidobacteria bacterium]|nr:MAG: hypothetical protein DMF82_10580 [Acidobacteriota bacterium]